MLLSKIKSACFFCFMFFLVGCATPYQSVGFWGDGYSDIQMNNNTYKITFRGNSVTSIERAEDFVLLRCAEITLAHGDHYFVITGEKQHLDISSYKTPKEIRSTINVQPNHYTGGTTATETTVTTGGETVVSSSPYVTHTITTYRTKPSSIPSYKAALVKQSLISKYGL